jgi:hypothetical protein
MLAVVPSSEVALIASLSEIRESVLFAAPEALPFWWRNCAEVLFEELGDHPADDGWQGKLVDIWMDRNRSCT